MTTRPLFILFFTASFLIHGGSAGAQALDSAVLKKFPAETILKLYDVAGRVKLSSQQQRNFATWIAWQDSVAADWAIHGRPIHDIDSLNSSTMRGLFHGLTQTQVEAYLANKGNAFTDIAAAGELAYLKEEYKPDSVAFKIARDHIHKKYISVYLNYLTHFSGESYTGPFGVPGKEAARYYDDYAFYPALYANRYVTAYLAKLAAIKRVPDSTRQKIREYFYATVSGDKYRDWAGVLNNATQWYFPDTALFSNLFHTEFAKRALELSSADRYNLVYMQRVSQTAYDSVYVLINEKNYKKAVLEYTYSLFHRNLFDSLLRLTTKYYDSTIEITLLKNGALQPNSQFAWALRYKDLLKLDPTLTDSMLQQVMFLNAKRDSILNRDPGAAIDFGPYEAEELSRLLTDAQYTLLLSYKNRSQAIADALADWREIELRGFTGGLNKDDVIRQITGYDLLKYNAWNRMADDVIGRWASLKALSANEPAIYKTLNPLRWNGDTAKVNNNLKILW